MGPASEVEGCHMLGLGTADAAQSAASLLAAHR